MKGCKILPEPAFGKCKGNICPILPWCRDTGGAGAGAAPATEPGGGGNPHLTSIILAFILILFSLAAAGDQHLIFGFTEQFFQLTDIKFLQAADPSILLG